jgi:hypothetical protein
MIPNDLMVDQTPGCEAEAKMCSWEGQECRSHHTRAFRITSVSSVFAKCRRSRSPAFS